MKSLSLTLGFFVAVAAFSTSGVRTVAAQECTGPFRECAIGARATCTRQPNGRQLMTYWDYPNKVSGFEQCVGRIFEAAGQQNPYKTHGAATTVPARRQATSALTVPDTELLYPVTRDNRD
jgi:hypothetical protein